MTDQPSSDEAHSDLDSEGKERLSTPSRRDRRVRQDTMRLASAGFELASFALILGAIGYGVDSWREHSTPYVAIAGLLFGFSLGFYRLIQIANRISP
ncbi:MAG: AtpZ/AtpI family protein [Planctomycetota bacterium]